MGKRPLCTVCLILIAILLLLNISGFKIISGNPLSDSLTEYLAKHADQTIYGEIFSQTDHEDTHYIVLKNCYMLSPKGKRCFLYNIKVYLSLKNTHPYGSILKVQGSLEEIEGPANPGEFNSKLYYACDHIYYSMKKAEVLSCLESSSFLGRVLPVFKEKISQVLEECAGEDAGIFKAMLLGDKTGLSTEVKLSFGIAGIMHILAISGLHVSMIGMGLFKWLKKAGLGNFCSGSFVLTGILLYGAITGQNISTLRAVCMFLMNIIAIILGRIYDPLSALALSGILLLIEAPAYLASCSFLLSFGAVLGIEVIKPMLEDLQREKGELRSALLTSFSITLATLPVTLWFYGEFSIAGILINLFVIPSVFIIVLTGALSCLIYPFSANLAIWFLLPGRLLLKYYKFLCDKAGSFSFSTIICGSPGLWKIIIYYVVLIFLFLLLYFRNQWSSKVKFRTKLLLKYHGLSIMMLSFFLLILFLIFPRPCLFKITMLDVGQGDGTIIETPSGCHFLIDGGSTSKGDVGQYQILPYLKHEGISRIDAILISHTDTDHVNGAIELLELRHDHLINISIGALLLPEISEKNDNYTELEKLAVQCNIPVTYISAGKTFQADDVEFHFIYPFPENSGGAAINESCMVFRLKYGNFLALFTGDIGTETEEKIMDNLTDIDFLKVAHHGSKYSSGTEFLERVRPEIGFISCSLHNTYGHPSSETIKRIENVGCRLFYTMKNGALTLTVSKGIIRVSVYKDTKT